MKKYNLERQITKEFLKGSLLKESTDDLKGLETREVERTKRSVMDIFSDLIPGLDKIKGAYSILANLYSTFQGSDIKDMLSGESYRDISYLLKLVDNINENLNHENIKALVKTKPSDVSLGEHILNESLKDIQFEGSNYQAKKVFDLQVGDSYYDYKG
tara:strand:- start:329 stop:802 length:474 start_codon:yes stop_codon:yes gene_type:complete